MPNYGVVDLGSNSIRLVIFEVKDDSKDVYTNKDFKSLLNDKVIAGLAAHVQEDVFTEAGIKRAIDVLKGHVKRARYFNCKRFEIFATAVLRNCTNSAEAIAAIEEGCGMPISLLSESDEARLGFIGATCDRTVDYGTLIDIGGGSTELTRIENGEGFDNVSLPQGSLSSYANYVKDILPQPMEMTAISVSMQKIVHAISCLDTYKAHTLYGIGGSIRAAAKMYAEAFGDGIRPKTMTEQQIHEILDLCQSDPSTFAHAALRCAPERVHTLVPGCLIANTLLECFEAEAIEICKYGVREGYLIERMLG